MPRQPRASVGGVIYHCLNRGNGRQALFHSPAEYDTFVEILDQAQEQVEVEMLGFCLMPDHWHLVLKPKRDGDLSRFMSWVCVTHVRRHQSANDIYGSGHLYQGRYRSFPVKDDRHLLTVMRFVESNPMRSKKVRKPEKWQWSSLAVRALDKATVKLAAWPVRRPPNWLEQVGKPMEPEAIEQVRLSIARGRPFGDDAWVAKTADRLGFQSSLRPVGRPRKIQPSGKK
jgi:putative transposase